MRLPMKPAVIVEEGVEIDLTQEGKTLTQTSSNMTAFTNLDTSKYYLAFGYQYSQYSNWHSGWSEEQLKEALGNDARRLGSYTVNYYNVTACIFKPQTANINIALGYSVYYFPIT